MILRASKNLELPSGLDNYSGVDIIKNTEIEFYLTGSWSFGTQSSFSDLDVYAENSKEAVDFLVRVGVKERSFNNKYGLDDPVMKRLFRYYNIHIQLVDPIDVKNKVQSVFETMSKDKRESLFSSRVLKSVQRAVWFSALHIAMGVKGTTAIVDINSKKDICPKCGGFGEDLVFAFYCKNPQCSNYKR